MSFDFPFNVCILETVLCVCLLQLLLLWVQLIVFVSCLLAGATRLLSSQIVRSLMSVEIDSVAFTLVSQTARMHVESLIVLICLIFSGATHSICLRQFLRVQFVDSLMTVRRSSAR